MGSGRSVCNYQTYYEHKVGEAAPGQLPPRAPQDQSVMPEIRRVWEETYRVYRARKIWRKPEALGCRCGTLHAAPWSG